MGSGDADQKNLNVTVSLAEIAAEVENDHQENAMKLAQDHDVSDKTVHSTLYSDLPLSVSRPAERSNCFTRRRRESNPQR
jgi:hypothetical protein